MSVEARLDIQHRRGTRHRAERREIRLVASGERVSGTGFDAVIHNVSATGLLLETRAELQVGDTVAVELPQTGKAAATVVWSSDGFYGCAFASPISRATLSAAQLQSSPAMEPDMRADRDEQAPASGEEPLGSRIRRLRTAKGLSLVEFAKRMQVSRPTVWAWEAGKSVPRKSKLKRLQEVLGTAAIATADPNPGDAEPEAFADELPAAGVDASIAELKARVAALAGTTPDKVRLVIEV